MILLLFCRRHQEVTRVTPTEREGYGGKTMRVFRPKKFKNNTRFLNISPAFDAIFF